MTDDAKFTPRGEPGDARVIADTATEAAEPKQLNLGGPGTIHDTTLVVARGQVIHKDAVAGGEVPRRKTGTVRVHTADALAAYAGRHHGEAGNAMTLWADVDNRKVVVVCNDHADDKPGWADHRAVLDLELSPRAQDWLGHNDTPLDQQALAEFLEERVEDVVEPSGSDLLDMTREFHATSSARFKSARSLHSGEVQLVYEEKVEASRGGGEATVPREFAIALPLFPGAELSEIEGRLRYRVNDGRLVLAYRLLNIEDALRAATYEQATVPADAHGLKIIEGVAPVARS